MARLRSHSCKNGMAENPKSILRRITAAKLASFDTRLSEDRPDEIARWCQRVHQVSRWEARRMLNPLIALDYANLDDQLVAMVEDALFFGTFGQERPAALLPP